MTLFIPYKSLKWYHDYLLNSRFRRLFLAQLTLRIGTYLFYIKKFITQFKITEKMRSPTRFRENGDFFPWKGSAAKKASVFNARALMTHEIMRSRDAQCNTGEWP